MESLHAPWRIEYILARKPELKEGLFASIAQSSDDVENYVVARDRTCFALLNRYPYNGGHLMVLPYQQVPDFPPIGATNKIFYIALAAALVGFALDLLPRLANYGKLLAVFMPLLIVAWIGFPRFRQA